MLKKRPTQALYAPKNRFRFRIFIVWSFLVFVFYILFMALTKQKKTLRFENRENVRKTSFKLDTSNAENERDYYRTPIIKSHTIKKTLEEKSPISNHFADIEIEQLESPHSSKMEIIANKKVEKENMKEQPKMIKARPISRSLLPINEAFHQQKIDFNFDRIHSKLFNSFHHSDKVESRERFVSWYNKSKRNKPDQAIILEDDITAGRRNEAMRPWMKGEVPKQRLPQVIIIGIGKFGTNTLLEYLKINPFVVSTSAEVHYFDNDDNFSNGLEWYRSRMPLSFNNQITVEWAPMYFWSPRAVEEIYKMNRTARLILVIRDPVVMVASRAARLQELHSASVYLTAEGRGAKVNAGSRTVDWGIYAKYLRGWLQKFPLKQIHLVETRDLKRQPVLEMQKLERFLKLTPIITERNIYFNKTSGNYCIRPLYPQKLKCLPSDDEEKPELSQKDLKLLQEFYKKYNEEFFNLINKRLDWNV